MSTDSFEQVEQITREPTTKTIKVKDPRRVAAGKKLAENNKRVREELEKHRQEIASFHQEKDVEDPDKGSSWFPEISLTTVMTLVGIGLTAFDLFIRFGRNKSQVCTEKKRTESHGRCVTLRTYGYESSYDTKFRDVSLDESSLEKDENIIVSCF